MGENKENNQLATFAGGCFWCMVQPFARLNGVMQVTAGYIGGHTENPTYEQVCSGHSGHYEAVQIVYNPSLVSYDTLLNTFWKQIDPTDPIGQFADKGQQYQTAIFFHNEDQKRLAEESKAALESSGKFDKPIATKILSASKFYPAEEYHQDYYKKNPAHYERYKYGSGRQSFIEKNWGKDEKIFKIPDDSQLRKQLSPLQYEVTRKNATEPPFKNEYWNNHKPGIYTDIISGEVLFTSKDKFDSGCGWPSFTKPYNEDSILENTDTSHFMIRTEVRSKNSDSHLGHVFNDGPAPTGLRYCINSAALKFIPVEDMEKEGYGEYLKLFENTR